MPWGEALWGSADCTAGGCGPRGGGRWQRGAEGGLWPADCEGATPHPTFPVTKLPPCLLDLSPLWYYQCLCLSHWHFWSSSPLYEPSFHTPAQLNRAPGPSLPCPGSLHCSPQPAQESITGPVREAGRAYDDTAATTDAAHCTDQEAQDSATQPFRASE